MGERSALYRRAGGEERGCGRRGLPGIIRRNGEFVFDLSELMYMRARTPGRRATEYLDRYGAEGVTRLDLAGSRTTRRSYERLERAILLEAAALRPDATLRLPPGQDTAGIFLALSIPAFAMAASIGASEEWPTALWMTQVLGFEFFLVGIDGLWRSRTRPLSKVAAQIALHRKRWGSGWQLFPRGRRAALLGVGARIATGVVGLVEVLA